MRYLESLAYGLLELAYYFNTRKKAGKKRKSKHTPTPIVFMYYYITSNNQRLRSAGDNDRMSNAEVSRDRYGSQKTSDQVTSYRLGPNACDQIAFCTFHSFFVEVQINAGYIHATHALYQPATWRLGLQAPLVARSNLRCSLPK